MGIMVTLSQKCCKGTVQEVVTDMQSVNAVQQIGLVCRLYIYVRSCPVFKGCLERQCFKLAMLASLTAALHHC